MNPDFWHQRWQRGEIGWHQTAVNLHLQDHWPPRGVPIGARVFVPLCGKSLDMLWLAGEGHRVLGVEVSPVAVEAFFEENGLRPATLDEPPFRRYRIDEIEILCGDFFDLQPRHLTDVGAAFDRASLIALPPQMRPRYASHLASLVSPETSILLVTLDYEQSEMSGPPFAVTSSEVSALLGGRFGIRALAEHDVLAENPRFRERGLTRLLEHVYELQPRRAHAPSSAGTEP
jgi:thiopurine S-methyltransferase